MRQIIENYNKEYKEYKGKIYFKLIYLIILFGSFFVPTIIYYNETLFVRILFWIFASIISILLILMFAFMLYKTERPMYDYLYKKILDKVFEDDSTHFEYECFPSQYPFIEKGHLFNKAHSEVVRYRLTYHYLNNRIDMYSFYSYSKYHKSNQLVFNGIYFVLHCENKSVFQVRTKGRLPYENKDLRKVESSDMHDIYLKDNHVLPLYIHGLFDFIRHQFDYSVYISGANKEVHIAIHRLYDNLAIKEINEEKLEELKNQLRFLIQLGKDMYKIL